MSSLVGIQRSFLWGDSESKSKVNWVSWNKVCFPKTLGRLGVKNLDLFNISLLENWRWRMLVDNEASWFKITLSRDGGFNHQSSLIDWNSTNFSLWWRDLCALVSNKSGPLNLLSKGLRRKVGNGANTLFWHDESLAIKASRKSSLDYSPCPAIRTLW